MTCEEFAMAGLDLGALPEDDPLAQAAREHLRICPHCATLHESSQALYADLRFLGSETRAAEAPARVEMRLRQEFRTQHKSMGTKRAALITAWSLATAAALVAVASWVTWHSARHPNVAHKVAPPEVVAPANSGQSANKAATSAVNLGEVLVTPSDSGDFTLLPGSMPSPMEDATVVRVQMQRGALDALGFTVNEERAGDWIQVDLLLGDDGLPQAVRLPQASN